MAKPRKKLRRFSSGEYRYMSSVPSQGLSNYRLYKLLTKVPEEKETISWASCATKNSIDEPFRKSTRQAMTANMFNGFYLFNDQIAVLGGIGLALAAPLALAYTGPVYVLSQFQLASTAVLSGSAISGAGLGGGLAAISGTALLQGLFGDLVGSKGPEMVKFSKPCGEPYNLGKKPNRPPKEKMPLFVENPALRRETPPTEYVEGVME